MHVRLLTLALCALVGGRSVAAAQEIDKELTDLAGKLATSIKEHGSKKVTVLDFTDLEGGSSELGRYIAEQLTVDLVMVKKDFSVVDRANLKKILEEHKLTSQGLVNPENAKKLGAFAGVDALILGNVIPKSTNVGVTAKIITTETAEIVGAARAEFRADDSVKQLLSHRTTEIEKVGVTEQAKPSEVKIKKLFGDLGIELKSLRVVNGSDYLLSMTVSNANQNRSIWVALHTDNTTVRMSRITDPNGMEFMSHGGNAASGIESAAYYKNAYRQDVFSPSTEIKPKDSISATVRFFARSNLRATPGLCNLQLQLLLGHDFVGDRGTVDIHNFVTEINADLPSR